MTKDNTQNSRSKDKMISKMYSTKMDDQSDNIYPKQSDQDDDSDRPT